MRAIANQNIRRSFNSLALPLSSQWSTSSQPAPDASTDSAAATSSSATAVPPAARGPPPHQLLSQRLKNHVASRHTSHSDLQYSLAISGNPSRVWGNYVTLLESAGYQRLPVELHQEVLRKCTPHFQKLRMAINKRMIAGNPPLSPHLHEDRFLTIIRNIRATGHTPDLEDYNFILSQFAATGHYRGSHSVYREILQLGHVPTPKTIGLCYQAIAHRFALPMTPEQRTEVVAETRDFFSKLMEDVKEHKVPLTAANMDLSLRILKESLDLEGLESLLRSSYGIDLSYPDQLPLDIAEQSTDSSYPLPFSTAALNTTIDILGRLGNISKMVQSFEVLTQPLARAEDHFFSSFDEDEDDIGAVSKPKSSWTPPSATPNTTTYSILLRHLTKANHPTLARHYILESIWLANKVNQELRVQLQRRPSRIHLENIVPPQFALSKSIVMPVLGYSNRRKNLSLMKWLCRKLPKVVKKKGEEVEFLTDALARVKRHREGLDARRRAGWGLAGETSIPPEEDVESTADEPLDVDVSSSLPPSPPPRKPFNLSTHLRITEQDYRELRSLAEYLDDLVGRTEQRVKERMGRRVWAGKNLFVASEGQRKVLTREEWKRTVKFPPRRGTLVGRSTKWANSDYFSSQNRRGFSTSFAGLGRS